MNGKVTDIEIAASLLKEMGHEALLSYFRKRLRLGRELETRPLLLHAFGRLAGMESKQLLVSVVNDSSERPKTRAAAATALGQLVNHWRQPELRTEVTSILITLLEDPDVDLRSAVALQLSELKAEEAVELLQKAVVDEKLNVLAGEEVQKFLASIVKPSANLPELPTTLIVARKELGALRDAFQHSRIVTLTGMGGVGKTTLAAQFARESQYDVKVWRSCRYSIDPADLANGLLLQLTEQLNPNKVATTEQIDGPHFDWGRIQNQIIDLLQDRSALIVLDDYEEAGEERETENLIERVVARLPKVSFLIVGRLTPRILNGVVVRLEGLSSAESLAVLHAATERRHINLDLSAAEQIIQLAEGNALVLNLYVNALSEGLAIDEVLRTDKEQLVNSLVNQSLKKLTDAERRTLEVLSQFDEPISARDPEIGDLFYYEGSASLRDNILHLNELSLALIDANDLVTLHSLVRQSISSRTDKRTILRVNRSLAELYQRRGQVVRAAIHLDRARSTKQAVQLIYDRLEDLISQGHLSSALEVLKSISSSKNLDLNAQMRIFISFGYFSRFRRQHEQAIDSYNQALMLARKLGDSKIEVSILFDIGRVNADIGAIDKALEYYRQGLEIAGDSRDRDAERIALGEIGRVHVEVGNSDQAIKYYERALAIAREIGDRKGEGIALGNIGKAYTDIGEADSSIRYHDERLAMARESGDLKGQSIALSDLGRAYLLLGMPERSVQCYDERLAIARQTGDKKSESVALGELGRAYSRMEMGERAVTLYEQRVMLAREIGDTKGESITLRDLGKAYSRLGMMDRAISYYEERRAIAREVGDRKGENNALGDLGRAYLRLGMTDRAINYYEERLNIAREIGDLKGESLTLGDLGTAYIQLDMSDRAVNYFEQRLNLARNIGDRKAESNALGDLGRAYSRLGMTDRAISFFEQRLTVAREIHDSRREGAALGALARSYVSAGNLIRAIQMYDELLQLVRQSRDRRAEGNVLGHLGRISSSLGEHERAVDFFNQQIVVSREISDRRSEGASLFNLSLEFDKLGERDKAITYADDSLNIFDQTQDPSAGRVRDQLHRWRTNGI